MQTDIERAAVLAELLHDPYPIYKQLRDGGGCAYFEAVDRYVIPRFKDVYELDSNPAISAREDNSLMTRAMGLNMRRLDGAANRRLRAACQTVLRGKTFTSTWLDRFRAVADELMDELHARGHADLVAEFAVPFAARAAKLMIGIGDLEDDDVATASQAFMDGVANHEDDPRVWSRCDWANSLIDDAVARWRERTEPGTVLRSMVDAGLTMDEIRANVKLFVGGSINEPRDLITSTMWALLRDPVQSWLVRRNPALLAPAAEETLRWLSPIGMVPRSMREDGVIAGVRLRAGTPLWVLIGSANRDERRWANPDTFDLRRASHGHVAFGHGPHVCLGAFMARRTIGATVLPAIFERLADVDLALGAEPQPRGWVLRGLDTLKVTWSTT
jgi:cytochrome P450